MSQIPHDPGEPGQVYVPHEPTTSGMAIASLVCGVLGVVTCFAFVPGVLAVVFAGVSLPTIRRGEAQGRGLAIAGMTLGVFDLVMGALFWILACFGAMGPEISLVPGREVSAADRGILEEIGVLEPDEEIELFYSAGAFSVRESGVVLTSGRLVVYHGDTNIETAPLGDVSSISFAPGSGLLTDGSFAVETDAGDVLVFSVGADEGGDRIFQRLLVKRVSEAREAAGKPAADTEVLQDEGD